MQRLSAKLDKVMGEELFRRILRVLFIRGRLKLGRREILFVVVGHCRTGKQVTREIRARWGDRHVVREIRSSRRRTHWSTHDRVRTSNGCHRERKSDMSEEAAALEV